MKDYQEEIRALNARVHVLEHENQMLRACLVEKNEDPNTVAALNRQLLSLQKEYLADVEKDIRILAECLERMEEATPADERQTDDALRWKKAYEDLANSRLGRLQRSVWRRTAKNRRG